MIDAVILDIGNVLIEWNPERHYDERIGEDRRRALFAAVDLHAMNDEIDRGAGWRARVYEEADRLPEWREEVRRWHDEWIHMARPSIPHSVQLMRELRSKGLPVHALSNFGVDSFSYACTQYPFLSEFDRAFISGRLRVIKPEPRIYEIAEEETGLSGARILYTDDREENLAPARARGWNVHLFDGPEGWAARLVAEGLLTEAEAAAR